MKSRWRIVALTGAFASAVTVAAVAQRGVVRGHVCDSAGKPLAYASIVLQWTQYGAMTDQQGRYSIEAPAGSHEVKAFMLGYATGSEHVQIGHGDTITVDFDLSIDPDSNEMKFIVVEPERRTSIVNVKELRLEDYP